MSGDAKAIYKVLTKTYPNVRCELDFKNPLQLLVATVLSAQCTDKRVNQVTPVLFKKYKSANDFANADIRDLEKIIRSTGFFRSKAKHIKGLARVLDADFKGKVPPIQEELVKLQELVFKSEKQADLEKIKWQKIRKKKIFLLKL